MGYPSNRELDYLRGGTEELDNFLISPQVYWQIASPVTKTGSTQSLDQLSIGLLLLTAIRLQAMELSPEETRQVEGCVQKIAEAHNRWLANWRVKAHKEFTSRMRIWEDFLHEVADDLQGQERHLTYAVRNRVICELLIPELEMLTTKEQENVLGIDAFFRSMSKPAHFIWKEQFASSFPEEKFSYLYRTIG